MKTEGLAWVIVTAALLLMVNACGGGRTAVIGFGNSGNRILEEWDLADELAMSLADHPQTPRISDDTLAEIFDAILERARSGDAESALIVLRVAERQQSTGAS